MIGQEGSTRLGIGTDRSVERRDDGSHVRDRRRDTCPDVPEEIAMGLDHGDDSDDSDGVGVRPARPLMQQLP